ncbi:MAG TPA: hypothetical protein VKM55_24900 [Candidatus Lokiarchaeia archaeon]|nr:hypothetical protein [Candidatus Lokiarchaeia archaeon]
MLIIDTCSWLKIKYLENDNVLRLKNLMYESDLWATHQLITECKYHLNDYIDYSRISIQTVAIDKLKKYSEKKLDDADLSIIEFARKNHDAVVICDDGAQSIVLRAFGITTFQLSEYMLFLVNAGIIKKNQANKVIKKLRAYKNIKEKEKEKLFKKINIA